MKKYSYSWQRLKADPLKMDRYRTWRKEYLIKKKHRPGVAKTLDSLFPVSSKNVVYKRVED